LKIFLMMKYKAFSLTIENYVANLAFNQPEKANALDTPDWIEMQQIFESLSNDKNVRVIILSGNGKHFCAGINLAALMGVQQNAQTSCEARKREDIREFIYLLQNTITSIEKCKKPVLAAIHNGCIGGAVDLIAACDMRYCTQDAYFTIKEITLGLVADIGTLQRLPKIIQPGIVAEMAYTGRKVYGPEAAQIGLVNKAYTDKAEMMEAVNNIAKQIAEKSPLCIRGTKEVLLYQRDHSVEDGLQYIANYNAAMLLSKDIQEAMSANFEKRTAIFED